MPDATYSPCAHAIAHSGVAGRKRWARALVATALLAAGSIGVSTIGPVGSASATTDGPCPTSRGVTVVVDFQELGGVVVKCTESAPRNGFDALRLAGFGWREPSSSPGFVCTISGVPDSTCVNVPPPTAYWSYWVAARGGIWCYAPVGAGGRTPPEGSVDGWSFALNKSPGSIPRPRTGPFGAVDGAPSWLANERCGDPSAPPTTDPPVTTPTPSPTAPPGRSAPSPAPNSTNAPAPGPAGSGDHGTTTTGGATGDASTVASANGDASTGGADDSGVDGGVDGGAAATARSGAPDGSTAASTPRRSGDPSRAGTSDGEPSDSDSAAAPEPSGATMDLERGGAGGMWATVGGASMLGFLGVAAIVRRRRADADQPEVA